MLETQQILLNTIFENPEVVALKILNNLSLAIENRDIERNLLDVGTNDEAPALLGNVSRRRFGHVCVGRTDWVAVHG